MPKKSPRLPRIEIGHNGLSISRIGLGCLPLTGAYGAIDEIEATSLIHAALDHGVNFLDTADVHGWGDGEALIGACIAPWRKEVVVATQFGGIGDGDVTTFADGRPEAVRGACEASLRRLKTDYIDIYLAHRIDPHVPIEETVGAMAGLVDAGKVRAIGLCEASPDTIRRAHRAVPLAVVQNEYSLLFREQAEEVARTAAELNIVMVASSPLARGFLTGSVRAPRDVVRDMRAAFPIFTEAHFDANFELLERLAGFAKALKCTPAQAALAWLLAQEGTIVPIPGLRSFVHLEQDIAALDLKLSPEEVDELSLLIPPDAVSGERYPPQGLASTYR